MNAEKTVVVAIMREHASHVVTHSYDPKPTMPDPRTTYAYKSYYVPEPFKAPITRQQRRKLQRKQLKKQ